MSKIKLTGHASGSGVLTVTAPNTSTDRTITLPDTTGTLLTADGDGSSLTGVGVAGITSAADATAITINSSEKVGIGIADAHHMLHIKENSTSNSLASGVKVQITNEQGAGNFASLRFTGSNQNGFIGYRDGANDQDRRISIGIGADAEHISFSQAGIKFNGDTAEANGLDDYEEGESTITISPASGSITLKSTHNKCLYTKIGRLVSFNIHIRVDSVSSPSGGVNINGLPFTCGSGEKFRASASVAPVYNFSSPSGSMALAWVGNNSTSMNFAFYSGSTQTLSPGAYFQANTEGYITGSYMT
jgi:hypothetical protein